LGSVQRPKNLARLRQDFCVRRRKPIFSEKRNRSRRLGLREGRQTIVTPEIRKIASGFKGNSALEVANEVVEFFRKNFVEKKLKLSEFAEVYLKRSASDIIRSGKIARLKKSQGEMESSGCVDYAVAACALLRASGIPAFFTRIGTHSTALFMAEKQFFEMDLTKDKAILPLKKAGRRVFSMQRRKGKFAMAEDAWSLGMRDIRDFDKTFE